jgi:hypothetical protein
METYKLILSGSQRGWSSTGITVEAGEELQVIANGIIRFARSVMGAERCDPSGKDKRGKMTIASKPRAPAPGLVRNSLVFRVDQRRDMPVQGGANTTMLCPASGELEMSTNADVCRNHEGSWNITVRRLP